MAEGLFRQLVKNRTDLEASSAGVMAAYGQPQSEYSAEILKQRGAELPGFASQPLTQELVDRASYIFAMTRGHLRTINDYFPGAAEKSFLLREFDKSVDGADKDVPDPIGRSFDSYLDCADAIQSALPPILEFIIGTMEKNELSEETAAAPAKKNLARVAIAADHGGVELKKAVRSQLEADGYEVIDLGTDSPSSVDYPDYAENLCQKIIADEADCGVLMCRSGIGMSITANRFPQIRAALVHDPKMAAATRKHNNANVICLAADYLDSKEEAVDAVKNFLRTEFEGGRHQRRLDKLTQVAPCAAEGRESALSEIDSEVHRAIENEKRRQSENIELIASENFTSLAVMEAQGSVLTNKYAEGYPGKRWYGGCEHVDVVEQLAIDRAKELFLGADHVNVQPHSGSQANTAVYFAALQPGDKILTMDLSHGGHLTHGHKANLSGRLYEVHHYGVRKETGRIDYDQLAEQAKEVRPKMITAGASAYPRIIDFRKMREIADSVGAYLFVDMAHIAGLVAGGEHPSPVGIAHFVTTTTHKSLRGPRGGMIICQEEFAKKIDSRVFPCIQGGPLMHVVAAKAVCLKEALEPEFKTYQRQIVLNAKALAERLLEHGYTLCSGGTDNHLVLVDLRPKGLTGKDAQEALDQAGVTINKNSIPFDTVPITKSGGMRLGTPAVTTRGMKEEEMREIADLIHRVLSAKSDETIIKSVHEKVLELNRRFPLKY